VSLRRMRKGVRAAPGEDRPGTPAVPSHPEAAAPTTQLQQQAASLCREHIHLVLARILQHEPGGRPNPASLHGASPDGAAAVSESARPRHLVSAVPHSPSKHSSSAAGRETGCPDSNARFRWDATVHRDTAVIMDVPAPPTQSTSSVSVFSHSRRSGSTSHGGLNGSWRLAPREPTHSLGATFGPHGREKGGAGRKDPCLTVAQATRISGFCHTRAGDATNGGAAW